MATVVFAVVTDVWSEPEYRQNTIGTAQFSEKPSLGICNVLSVGRTCSYYLLNKLLHILVTLVLEQYCIAMIYISFVQSVQIKNVVYEGSEVIVLKNTVSPIEQEQI